MLMCGSISSMGEYFFNHHAWSIDHSVFSWTPASKDWPYVSWLGSSLMYLVYIIFPLPVLFALPAILKCIVFLLYLAYLRSISAHVNLETLSLFLIIALCMHSPVKPAIFSWFFFSLCVAIYFSTRRQVSRRWYLWYPIIFLLWVNTHGAFLFGLLFLCLAFLSECLVSLLDNSQYKKTYLLGFGVSIALSFIVLIINPYGLEYLRGIAQGTLFVQDFADPSKYVSEYTHLWSTFMPTGVKVQFTISSWYAIFLLAMYVLFVLLAYRKGRRPDIASTVLTIFFFAASMLYARCLAFFGLVSLFSISYFLATTKDILPSKYTTAIIAGYLLYASASVAYSDITQMPRHVSIAQNVQRIYPFQAVQFLKDNQLPQPILNTYLEGGYLLWSLYPDYKVFVDPRYGPYRKNIIEDAFAFQSSKSVDDIKKTLAKYPANTVFIGHQFINLFVSFLQLPEWKLVYFDNSATIFVRKSALRNDVQLDMSVSRFANLDSADSLKMFFDMYMRLNSPANARIIRDIYKRNVPSTFYVKEVELQMMDILSNTQIQLSDQSGQQVTNSP